MTAQLSIVVPFYGVERYLEECLASLAAQTFADIEVIMVDDGSPDRSAEIAERFAERDTRFHLVRQENQGLGPARNTGVEHARGDYLAFVDSDDVVARHAYELLVGSLEETGSDIASGNVARFNSGGVYASGLHATPLRTTRRNTHVTQQHSLLMDRTAWNKVFRRSFWDAHGLEFPPGLYEDTPVMVPAHFLAESVDVFHDTVYYYRAREDDTSITQRRTEMANMTARMESIRYAANFLHGNAPHELARAYDERLLSDDILIFLNVLGAADDDYRRAFQKLAVPFIEAVDDAAFAELPSMLRLKYHLLREGRFEELLEVLDFDRSGQTARAELVRRRGRWYARYPFFADTDRGVPDGMYRLDRRELQLRAHLDDVTWRDGRIHVTGHAYIHRLGATHRWRGPLIVLLRRAGTRRVRPVRVTRRRRPDVTARLDHPVSYDWSGFEFDIDPARLGFTRDPKAAWEVHVLAVSRATMRRGPLGRPMPGHAEHPSFDDVVVDGTPLRVHPTMDSRNHFVVRSERIEARLDGHAVNGGRVELTGVLLGDQAAGANDLVLRRRLGTTTLRLPITRAQDVPTSFTASVELSALTQDPVDGVRRPSEDDPALHETDIAWEVAAGSATDDQKALVTVGPDFTETSHALDGREIAITHTRHGHLNLIERLPRLVVDDVRWTPADALELRGTYTGPAPRPAHLELRLQGSTAAHRFPVEWSDDGDRASFTAALSPGELTEHGHRRAIGVGMWNLFAGSPPRPVRVTRRRLNDLPDWRPVGFQQMAVRTYRLDALRLSVRRGYTDEERGQYGKQRLRDTTYPVLRRRPLRDVMLFQSYFGSQYSCNPRAVYEEIARRDLGLTCVWVTGDGRFRAPRPAETVLAGTREHYEALSTARYLVSNTGLQDWFVKRDDQIYVQTWHGSPLKRIGLDIEAPTFERGRRRMEALRDDAAAWDLLLSQSPFTTPILRRALRYGGDVAELGYPRNDRLHGPGLARETARARERLGIPAGRRVVLYAPTWRDNLNTRPGEYGFELRLDLDALRAALGGDHVILLRAHHLVTRRAAVQDDGFVYDVSGHPDINELFLAADTLITDYSSAMFDYAGLNRPIIVFAPDLDQYRDTVRGLSFPIEDHAPGPILEHGGDVVDALRDIDAVARDHAPDLARFRDTFAPFDDGHAAERLVDRILSGGGR